MARLLVSVATLPVGTTPKSASKSAHRFGGVGGAGAESTSLAASGPELAVASGSEESAVDASWFVAPSTEASSVDEEDLVEDADDAVLVELLTADVVAFELFTDDGEVVDAADVVLVVGAEVDAWVDVTAEVLVGGMGDDVSSPPHARTRLAVTPAHAIDASVRTFETRWFIRISFCCTGNSVGFARTGVAPKTRQRL